MTLGPGRLWVVRAGPARAVLKVHGYHDRSAVANRK